MDWEPTTAIIGRLTSRLTSERRMISWNEGKFYLDFRDDRDEFLHEFRDLQDYKCLFCFNLWQLIGRKENWARNMIEIIDCSIYSLIID